MKKDATCSMDGVHDIFFCVLKCLQI